MQYELNIVESEASGGTRRVTTLHLLLAFGLVSLGICCLLLYWFSAGSQIFKSAWWYASLLPQLRTAHAAFAVFGMCCIIAGTGIGATVIFFRSWLGKGKRNTALRVAEIILLAGACGLFGKTGQKAPAIMFGIMAALLTAVAVLELRKPGPQKITLSEGGILVPNRNTVKRYLWKEVVSVLLRHNILSIELSGNRLIQKLVSTAAIDTNTVEGFCSGCIIQHEGERAAAANW